MNWRTILLAILVLLLLGIFLPTLIRNYRELEDLKDQESQKSQELEKARRHFSDLAREKQELETNPESIELLARDKLGYAREDEVLYIFPSTPVPGPTP